MVRISKFALLIVFTFVLVLSLQGTTAQAEDPGEAGLLSLRLGVGAREAGMGGAGVASSQGASAVFWNPANNVFADFETELVLQHYRYLGMFNHEAAAVAHKAGSGVFGFMFTGLYADEIPRYGDEPVAVPEGSYRPYDVSFGISYARKIGESIGLAAAVKMVYERIDLYSDTGFAFDFFFTHKTKIDGLIIAASATNIGGQMNLRNEPFDLPTAYRVGLAWSPKNILGDRLTFTGDMVFPNDTDEKAHFGAELRIIPELTLRGGSKMNYDAQGWTAGAGFRSGILGVDYAYEDIKIEGFDSGHKFSLNLHW